jgi:hypothetical protein
VEQARLQDGLPAVLGTQLFAQFIAWVSQLI